MKQEVEIDAYKRIPLEILKHVTEFCKENNIIYSLAYGTLLGAVRHKGYIPWDDDIDIYIPRKDYEIFRKLYHSEKYPFIDLMTDNKYPIGIAKVYDNDTYYYYHNMKRKMGLYIDIFVLDNFPNDESEQKKWLKKISAYRFWNTAINTPFTHIWKGIKGLKRKIHLSIIKIIPISPSYIHLKLEKLFRKYESINCECVGSAIDVRRNYKTFVFPKYFFEHFIELEFEGSKFMATKYYDEALTILYGDYMQLPPEEKRIPKHGLKAYYK